MDVERFQKVCIGGWGKSGVALCRLLLTLKKEVKVSEAAERKSFDSGSVDEFKGGGVEFEFGGHSLNFLKGSELLILSPGIDPLHSPLSVAARTLGIPCVGEVEFAFWMNQAKLIAITGTNGKTTTAYLTWEVLRQKRKRVFLGGNIGTPFTSFVLDTKKGDLAVLEISSFQLETILKFKPHLAALLNIEPDHLDRYPDFESYFQAKLNIFRNQDSRDLALLNADIAQRLRIEREVKSRVVRFSREFSNPNYSCVYRIAREFGFSKVDCLKVFNSFPGVPHRLQMVRRLNRINFVNDSKATNVASTVWAFNNIKSPVILLAGGKDKGLDYTAIKPYRKRIKHVNLFGEASAKIKRALEPEIEAEVFASLEGAVKAAFRQASPGDTVLLSPMCSSFDEFSGYAERGDKFTDIVHRLCTTEPS